MKRIINELGNIVLYPEEGKVLTNGECIAENEVYLGIYDNSSNWFDIDPPIEEKEEEEEILIIPRRRRL